MSGDAQATFCATLVDRWVGVGAGHAVVAPGSRSTPLAVALADRDELTVHVVHDERSAGFVALGIGLTTGVPAILLCTSGTAATHFHAAVVEADLSGVPMLVCTADRPPELQGIGAPQTIDQRHLYGGAPRAYLDPGVPGDVWLDWTDLAMRAWRSATGVNPGPVHVNLPFREPLLGVAGPFPASFQFPEAPAARAAVDVPDIADTERGVIVAGRGVDDPAAVGELATASGWPVLADPRSGCRRLTSAVCAADALLRDEGFAKAHRPDVVLHLGEPPASKVLGQWLADSPARHVMVHARPRVIDPLRIIDQRLIAQPSVVCAALARRATGRRRTWLDDWLDAERRAQEALAGELDDEAVLTEPGVARGVVAAGFDRLVVASSMPVRDVEWYGAPSATRVLANRGANGIDGVLATAIGAAASAEGRTAVLLGDIAFCHDASSLTALARRRLELTIVVVDNDGGGIFSFLPQAEQLDGTRFEQLFGTAHGTDVVSLAAAHGLAGRTVGSAAELRAALTATGTTVVRVATDRRANVTRHAALHAAVSAAL